MLTLEERLYSNLFANSSRRGLWFNLDVAESASGMSVDDPPAPGSLPDLDDESPPGHERFRSGEFSEGLRGEKRGLDVNSFNQVGPSFLF